MTRETARNASTLAILGAALAVFATAGSAEAYTHNTTPGGHPVRWSRDEVRIVVDESVSAIAPVHAVEAVITEAFETWTVEADLPIDFAVERGACGEPGYSGDESENCVMACYDCVPHGEDTGAKAVVSHVLETGEIVDADIVFFIDAGEWTLGHEPGAISVGDVALHEVGHVLGLAHSDVPDARMYSSLNTSEPTAASALHSDDIEGAAALYPAQAPDLTTAGCGWRCTAASGAPGGAAGCLLFAAASILLGLRRRRG